MFIPGTINPQSCINIGGVVFEISYFIMIVKLEIKSSKLSGPSAWAQLGLIS